MANNGVLKFSESIGSCDKRYDELVKIYSHARIDSENVDAVIKQLLKNIPKIKEHKDAILVGYLLGRDIEKSERNYKLDDMKKKLFGSFPKDDKGSNWQ